ncbi:MAG: malto-oligosyltrehalose synthase [Xanthobacteraceae bacterium]
MTIPRATMRLQFHQDFRFADAEALVPYFARLGISHIYASPITTARPGSKHGYDVINPAHVNPELGGEGELRSLVTALRSAGLGLIVDIVPNHMAVGAENAWWYDVLKHGQASRYAAYFDIDWNAEDAGLRGKVLLPVLGKPAQEALRDRELVLAREAGGYVARYFQQRFPITGDVHQDEDLAAVLARQHYRLAWWRVANDEINWRRFFDINELAALRMENPDAFEEVHALIFRLYAEGIIDGVRVDHIDGLADPEAYCRKLRARLDLLTDTRPPGAPRGRPYIIVEKILLHGETLPASWECDGTSGYDFMNQVSAVQHDAAGEPLLDALWEAVSGRSANFATEEETARRQIITGSFSAQLDACAADFHRLARAEGRESSRADLRCALIELLTHFPVYRTYPTALDRLEDESPFIDAAVAAARRTSPVARHEVIERLHGWLIRGSEDAGVEAIRKRAVTRFQQLSAPVAAKSVEDTAFYRYGRLISRNDVGFDVTRFSDDARDFHAHMTERQATFPNAMLATATHDHKRGEDVRARLAVLSEYAAEWSQAVPRWLAQCKREKPVAADIAILFQMIVGAWPLDLYDEADRIAFADRLAQWQQKALREAKLATSWSAPNEAYETAARELVTALVARNEKPELLNEIVAFAERIAPAGAVNGLAQVLLKLTAPGVPDIYQGTELWDFSLVDPDNRRPVDFVSRARPFSDDLEDPIASWRDGRIKQSLIARTLAVRKKCPALFTEGQYLPLDVIGGHARRIVAFARHARGSIAITVVPRTASRLLQAGTIQFEPAKWGDTAIALQQHKVPLIDAFCSAPYAARGRIAVAELFEKRPFALLVSSDIAG